MALPDMDLLARTSQVSPGRHLIRALLRRLFGSKDKRKGAQQFKNQGWAQCPTEA
jgi:hypothetical protein